MNEERILAGGEISGVSRLSADPSILVLGDSSCGTAPELATPVEASESQPLSQHQFVGRADS